MNGRSITNARKRVVSFVALCATIAVASPVAQGVEDPIVGLSGFEIGGNENDTEYWTPDRMRDAIPMPAPVPTEVESELGEGMLLEEDSRSVWEDASLPEVDTLGVLQMEEESFEFSFSSDELDTDGLMEDELPAEDLEPGMVSSRGYPFTTRRASPDSTVNSWPFRLAGKFFFTKPDGNYVCSASIIQRRIVITAGHCVYDRDTNRFYRNFAFVPAYNGNATDPDPYCTWYYRWGIVPWQWRVSSGYPTSDDFALLEMGDRTCGTTSPLRIGSWLGWLGWSTYRLLGNNITQLGYPGNLDSGRRMQVSQSNVYRRRSYAGEIGSAQGRGASGGPWIQNFGRRPSGQVSIGPSGYTGSNQVVGVSSYLNTNHNSNQYYGASVLNNNFVRIWNTACAHRAGNCSP